MILVDLVLYISVWALFTPGAQPVLGLIFATAWIGELVVFFLGRDWGRIRSACGIWGFSIAAFTILLVVFSLLSPVAASVAAGLGLGLAAGALNNWVALFSALFGFVYVLAALLAADVRAEI